MKNRVNYKSLNILLLLGIIYLLFLMKGVWIGVVSKLFSIILPFVIAFAIAYVLYPIMQKMIEHKIPKFLSILILLIVILLISGLTIYFAVPLFIEQLVNLINNLIKLSGEIATKYGVDMKVVNDTLNDYYNMIITGIGSFISNGSLIGLISKSVNYLSKSIIVLIVSIYFLADMEKIRLKFKMYLKRRGEKTYELVKKVDDEINSYLKGLGIFMIIQFFEYTLLFMLVGHPNFLLIGVLACLTTVIPYFGGIITNAIALVIASVVSPKLFILTLIITLVFPNIDGYIISPKIYGKTNQLPALLSIFAVTAGGALYGFVGIIIAIPLTIIIVSVINTYWYEINDKISQIKKKM